MNLVVVKEGNLIWKWNDLVVDFFTIVMSVVMHKSGQGC